MRTKEYKDYSSFHFLKSYSVFLLVTFFVNSPYVFITSAQWDDYNFFTPERVKGNFNHPQIAFVFLLGRPLTSLFLNFSDKYIHTLESLIYFRFFSILMLAFLATLFHFFFHKLGFTLLESFCLSVCIVTLPGMSFAVNLVMFSPAIFATILSVLAFLINFTSDRQMYLDRKISVFKNVISVVLLLVSMFIYPASSGLFIFMCIVVMVFNSISNGSIFGRDNFWVFLNFCFASTIYFLMCKFIIVPKAIQLYPDRANALFSIGDGMYKFENSFDISIMLENWFRRIFTMAANLWFIQFPEGRLLTKLLFTIGLMFLFIMICIRLLRKRIKLRIILLYFSFIFALVVCTTLPNFMAPSGYVALRNTIGLSCAILFIIFLAIRSIYINLSEITLKRLSVFGLLFTLLVTFASFQNNFLSAKGNEIELLNLGNRIQMADGNLPRKIFVIAPDWSQSKNLLDRRVINDEFNMISRAYPEMINAYFLTFLDDDFRYPFDVVDWGLFSPDNVEEDWVIIDMRIP